MELSNDENIQYRITRLQAKRKNITIEEYNINKIIKTKKSNKSNNMIANNPVKSSNGNSDNISTNLNNIVIFNDDIIPVVKKIDLSDQEKAMNGAPEGEIFDMKLLINNELTNTMAPVTDIPIYVNSLFDKYQVSTVWAERFILIEDIRKVILFYSQSLSDNDIQKSINIALLELDSLRSTSIRNSLYLIELIIVKFSYVFTDNNGLVEKCLSKLINKLGSSPKFIIESISTTITTVIQNITSIRALEHLELYINNKNIEISSKVFILLCELVINMDINVDAGKIFTVLYTGLSSKSSLARDKIKQTFMTIKNSMTVDKFNDLLQSSLNIYQINEINRFISVNNNNENVKSFTKSFDKKSTLSVKERFLLKERNLNVIN